MKKKNAPIADPVISKDILEHAKRTLQSDTLPRQSKCVVCSSEVASNSVEGLCWVCRRLKISAWRDSDQQMLAQE